MSRRYLQDVQSFQQLDLLLANIDKHMKISIEALLPWFYNANNVLCTAVKHAITGTSLTRLAFQKGNLTQYLDTRCR